MFCFSPINRRMLLKKTYHRFTASTYVFTALLASAGLRVWFRALGYLESGLCGQCQFPWFPLSKGGYFGAWCICEVPVKRWLCVLKSQAQRGQNSSVTPAELELCSTADGREVRRENTEAACEGPGTWPVRSSGTESHSGGSQEESNQATIYIFTQSNTFNWKDTDRHKPTSVQTQTLTKVQAFRILSYQKSPLIIYRGTKHQFSPSWTNNLPVCMIWSVINCPLQKSLYSSKYFHILTKKCIFKCGLHLWIFLQYRLNMTHHLKVLYWQSFCPFFLLLFTGTI